MIGARPKANTALAIGVAVALLALVLRVLVPAGWMPTGTPAGGWSITLCTGTGEQAVTIDKDGKPVTPSPTDQKNAPCAFSGLGAPALDALPPTVVLQLLLLFFALGFAAVLRPALPAASWLRPPLRAPPQHI